MFDMEIRTKRNSLGNPRILMRVILLLSWGGMSDEQLSGTVEGIERTQNYRLWRIFSRGLREYKREKIELDTALEELENEQLAAISIDFWVPTEEEIAVLEADNRWH